MTDSQRPDRNGRSEREELPPVQDLLRAAGAMNLGDSPSPEARRAVLDQVVSMLDSADELYVRQVRNELVKNTPLPATEVDARLRVGSRGGSDRLQGQAVALADPEPWPEPVEGAELLSELEAMFCRFLVLPRGVALLVPLWTVLTHAFDAFSVAPYLAVSSPVMRCGKSNLLILLLAVCRRAVLASNLTPATIFRVVDAFRPTLLLDEADTFLERNLEIPGLLNSGHSRLTGQVLRCAGDDSEVRSFNTYCPKAIALIGRLRSTLDDRSVQARMQRKAPGEEVERLRLDRLDEFGPLQRKAWRWAQDHIGALRSADPEVPEELNDRAADNWRPLLSIADLVGGSWPEEARQAAVLLSTKVSDDETELGIKLLEDIKTVFHEERKPRLGTSEIIHGLTSRDREWSEHRDARPITAVQLARLLRPFEVRSRDLWFAQVQGGKTLKGYRIEDFADAWRRYVPAEQDDADTQGPQEVKDDADI